MKIRLGVLFGGMSVEHEVSIITAIQAMNNLDTTKYEIIPIYIAKDGVWYTGNMLKDIEIYSDMDLLKRYAKEVVLYNTNGRFVLQNKKGIFRKIVSEIDLAFPIMHGTHGEDGALQGYFETIKLPYCESNTYACCVGQDKVFMKQIFETNKVNVARYKWFFDADYSNDTEKVIKEIEKLGYPVVVKPATLGSSVGISVCHDALELNEGLKDAFKYDTKVIVEEFIKNAREVNISVLGNYEHQELSPIEEVGSANEVLTYEDKYIGGNKKIPSKGMASAKRQIPANLSSELVRKIQEQAIRAYKALNSSGVVRIDFLISNDEVYAIEANTIPGSLSFYLWDYAKKSYKELLDDIINIGIKDYKKRENKTITFETNILKGFKGLKGAKGIKK